MPATSPFSAPDAKTSNQQHTISSLRGQHAIAKKVKVDAVLAEKERILASARVRKREQRRREWKEGYRHPVGQEEMSKILQMLGEDPDLMAEEGRYEQKGEKWAGEAGNGRKGESTAEKMLELLKRAKREMARHDRQTAELLLQKERELEEERRGIGVGGGNPGLAGSADARESANASGNGGERSTDPRLR
jgi:hypothetical protein